MNRTLTAAVALAAGLGMAGIAQAQTNGTTPNPSMSPSSSRMQNPQPMSPSSTTGNGYNTQPQANSQTNTMNSGAQPASVSQSEIQQAQQELKAQGLYRGAVDGVNGPETQQAVMKFQQKQGLPATAQLDQQTIERLSGSQSGQPTGTQGMTPSPRTGTENPATQNSTTGTTPGGAYNR